MLILKNISRLVTPVGSTAKKGEEMNDVKVVQDAVVACKDGIFVYVGDKSNFEKKFGSIESLASDKSVQILDCENKAVLPGFVDSHTHLVFGGYRDDEFLQRAGGATYMEIMQAGGGIAKSVRLTKEASQEELLKVAQERIEELLKLGITAVEIKSGYGLDKDTELKQLRVIAELKKQNRIDISSTFLGAHSVPKEYKDRENGGAEYIDYIIETVLPVVKEENLAEFVDIFCEKGVFSIDESEKLLTTATASGFKTKIHADEIVCLGGAELAVKVGCTSADHLLHISPQGIKDLANSKTIATLLPLTAFCLSEPFAPARALIDGGAAVALSTDFNPGSCFSFSIPLLIGLSVLKMKMSINEVITALTLNGACAIDKGDTLGTIEEGKSADLIILKYNSENFLAYHTGVNCVEKVVKRGEIVV
jgi:imidazolonepropionase